MAHKRPRSDTMEDPEAESTFLLMFEGFRKDLDEHHDRRERVIKRSRDITAASKKIIFGLQRMRTVNETIPAHVQKTIKPHEDIITTNYAEVSKELQGLNSYRYSRNITGGNQEFIESETFKHYLATGRLMTYDETCERFQQLCSSVDGDVGPQLSAEDYILGLYDMTGELMRFAITAMATSGALPSVDGKEGNASGRNVLTDLRALSSGLESLDVGHGSHFGRDVEKKKDVMRSSVEKVERALYGLNVRGAERPKGWMPELDGGGRGREVDVEG